MRTEILPASSPDTIRRAYEALQRGSLVALPTDTVYGLGALAFDGKAVESIYVAKDRPVEKAIPILIGELDDLERVGTDIPDVARQLASRFWPGPLTLLVPKRSNLPEAISATSTVGVRMPDHEVARALLRTTGPLAVTSANISGGQSPVTAREVYEQLGGRISLIIDGGQAPGGVASTVVDCTTPDLKISREGPISSGKLRSALKKFGVKNS